LPFYRPFGAVLIQSNNETGEHHLSDDIRPEIANMAPEQMERVIAETQPNVPESKPTIFDHSGDSKLTKEMGAVFDKAEAKGASEDELKTVPSIRSTKTDPYGNVTPGDSLDTAFEKTWDYLNAPKAEQETQRDAHQLMEQVRKNAEKFGLKLDDSTAMWAAMQMEEKIAEEAKAKAGNEYAPAAEAMRSVYKDQDPNQTAAWFRDVKASFDSDPVGATAWAAQQYGMHPLQLAAQIYQRYGQQQTQPTQQDVNRLYGIVEQAYAQTPRMAELEEDILAELNSSKRSGDPAKDLHAAYRRADAKNSKRSTGDKIGRSMNATFDRVSRR
jgi:hypothetical protein